MQTNRRIAVNLSLPFEPLIEMMRSLHAPVTDVKWIEFLRSSKSRAGTGAQPLRKSKLLE